MTRNAYEYLFYKLYRWSVTVNGPDFAPRYTASGMMSLTFMFNAVTCWIIFDAMTGHSVHVSRYVGGLAVVAVWALNYSYFSVDGREAKILRRYRTGVSHSARRGTVIVATYVIGSLVSMLAAGFVSLYLR
jgi:hypothetical protein